MQRASAARPALLMATATAALLVARVHSLSALEAVNPWLSACDLVQPAATDDLQGACSSSAGLNTNTNTVMMSTGGPGPPPSSTLLLLQQLQKQQPISHTTTITATTTNTNDACPPPCATTLTTITTTTTGTTTTTAAAATTTTTTATTAAAAIVATTNIYYYYNNSNNNNNNNNNTTINQCLLYLEESHKDAVCDSGDREQRLRQIQELRLRHCCEHAVVTALKPRDRLAVLAGGAKCKHHLDALLEVDALAARISCEFTEVLTRYDCGQPYSIVYHCDDCKEAYRRWVCSSLVPHLTETGGRVRPCRTVCQTVEQRCPYMLPGDRAPAHPTQYAGEPTFLCLDPNIPETGKQKVKSSHGDEECCYTYCGTAGRPCAHCPGGASNDTWEPVACAPSTSGVSRAASECRVAVSASSSYIINSVWCRWTTWTILILHILITHADMLQTMFTHILHCSLLMCVHCARTTLALIQTKWKSRSS